ncbi:hypothetical protein ACJRO7_003769 [Eucalyptus globulus]|uniref:Uncharacterized protein n=1 Tax=Eucalyptus globulus TaxID=34317 RepID=A0ABD3IXR9_EUCGL
MASTNANTVSPGGSSSNVRARSPDAGSDGKNRSLPPKECGPHQCPRCYGLISTSEVLEEHVPYCRPETQGNKRRKLQVKRKPYRANRIQAGGEPKDHGDSTNGKEEAEGENPSKEH